MNVKSKGLPGSDQEEKTLDHFTVNEKKGSIHDHTYRLVREGEFS